jgi:cytochrome P450
LIVVASRGASGSGMQTLSLDRPETRGQTAPPITHLSWRAVARALAGDALAAFPAEAFDEEFVVQSFFGRDHILLQSPDAIRHVLIDNAQNYTRAPAVQRVLRPMFGRGLFLSAGDDWRGQRRAVAPAFAPRAVRVLARQVVANTEALAGQLAATGEEGVNLVPLSQQLALGIIGEAIFSLDMPRYRDELRSLIIDYALRLSRPSLADYLLPLRVPAPRDLARALFRRRWLRMIGHIIADRAGRKRDGEPRDLFDILAAPDPETGAIPDCERLGDQIATIVVAGHETTAAGLFWCLYLLARHPEVQARVAGEVAALGPNPANAAELLPHLKYTRAVVDETLRLYPPAFVIVRRAAGDDCAAGIPVPRGSLLLIAPWVLHRHRRVWPRPTQFDPGRFLPGAPSPPRFAYLPFGAGPRVCVGAPFALTELVLVTATLVNSFAVGLCTDEPVTPIGLVTLQPNPQPLFRLTPRQRCGSAMSMCGTP